MGYILQFQRHFKCSVVSLGEDLTASLLKTWSNCMMLPWQLPIAQNFNSFQGTVTFMATSLPTHSNMPTLAPHQCPSHLYNRTQILSYVENFAEISQHIGLCNWSSSLLPSWNGPKGRYMDTNYHKKMQYKLALQIPIRCDIHLHLIGCVDQGHSQQGYLASKHLLKFFHCCITAVSPCCWPFFCPWYLHTM